MLRKQNLEMTTLLIFGQFYTLVGYFARFLCSFLFYNMEKKTWKEQLWSTPLLVWRTSKLHHQMKSGVQCIHLVHIWIFCYVSVLSFAQFCNVKESYKNILLRCEFWISSNNYILYWYIGFRWHNIVIWANLKYKL